MAGKITYTPFISKPIPESSAISPIPISFPIWEYQGADPDREVIPIQYVPETQTVRIEAPEPQKSNTYNLKEARKTISKRKGSHQFKSKDIKVGNMQGFLDEAAKYGIYFRVTSGVREGAETLNGNTSNHATGNAIDVTPLDGQSWDELIAQIKNTPELLDYMRKNKMRILDERSSEMLAKTGGTGAHFHLSFGKTEGKGVDEYFV